jgi:DNA-binding LacI/PurR family transcriptional regulator
MPEFSNVPFIFVNCLFPEEISYSITIDQQYALKLCVDHLKEKGHRNILYVNDAIDKTIELKSRDFLDAMNKAGLPAGAKSVITSRRLIDSGVEAVDRIIEGNIPFTAIILRRRRNCDRSESTGFSSLDIQFRAMLLLLDSTTLLLPDVVFLSLR